MPIPQEKADRVKRLLETGTSARKIQELTGISRGTITKIANGQWRPQIQRAAKTKADQIESSSGLARCPGCGGLVCMPCLRCRIAALPRPLQPIADD